MGLFNLIVAVRRGDHLLVVDVDQAGDLPDRGAVTPQLIGVNDFWDIIFAQKPGQEGFRGFSISVAQFLNEVSAELDAPFAEGLVEEWRPHAGRRAEARPSCPRRASVHDDADLDAALVKESPNVPVAERNP